MSVVTETRRQAEKGARISGDVTWKNKCLRLEGIQDDDIPVLTYGAETRVKLVEQNVC